MKDENKTSTGESKESLGNAHGSTGRRAEIEAKFDHPGHGPHGHVAPLRDDPPDRHLSLKQSFAEAPPAMRRWATGILLGAVILVTCVTVYRHIIVAQEAAAREAEILAGSRVKVAKVAMSKGERLVNLVGEAKPFAAVTLYAKVSGYLRNVKVDKGDHVKKGQILATIDVPETNSSLEGLGADSKNKQMIAKRMQELRAKNLASAQEAEQAESDAAVAKSRFDTLAVQQGEQFLRAPFDGTVTARYADPGALVQSALNSQTSSLPVVSIAQTEKLRVYVYVDQRDASFITPGRPVSIHLTERPEVEIKGAVTRISGELDPSTRMLLTEIDVENKDNLIVAGSFVQVAISLATPTFLQVPAEALVPGKDKSTIPVVSEDGHLHFQDVKIADNDGKSIQIISGLKEGDVVALNVGSGINEGSKVRPVMPEASGANKSVGASAPIQSPGADTKAKAAATGAPPSAAAPAVKVNEKAVAK